MVSVLPGIVAADEARVQELIEQMTIEEKVGQMTQVTLAVLFADDMQGGVKLDPEKLKEAIHTWHVGSILNTGSRSLTVEEWHRLIKTIQDEALAARVPIPVIYGIDAIHGVNYTKGSTLFPHNIGLAATRDPQLVAELADVTAKEVRASGIRWNFDPVMDIGRNPLWSRFEETYGEDSYLAGVLGAAAIAAYEKDDLRRLDAVASCMKHYIGYSDPANGKDRTPAYIPYVELWEHHLPPFEAAVAAGASTAMINSASVNGMPVHGSKELLTDTLRGKLGFDGLVVSDWEDVKRLHTRHQVAETPREAVRMGVEAGIDMSMVPHDFSFAEHLVSLVKDGEVSEERIDRSVATILELKFRLGLFDNAYAEPEATKNFGLPEYQDLALEAARRTITLLKNTSDTLPLAPDARVLLAGPAAHNLGALHGSWSYTWQGRNESAYPDTTLSFAAALVSKTRTGERGSDHITLMGSADFSAPENVDTRRLEELAADADVIVLALGEHAYAESPGALDDLDLAADQQALAAAAVATGKPVVVVLFEGRPRVLGDIPETAAAVLQAYRPGSRGAEAVVDVLYGDYNPSGALPYSYHGYSGDITPYDRRVLADIQQLTPGKVTRGGYKPAWPFGHGLSYTDFELANLRLDRDVLVRGEQVTATVQVTNSGERAGDKLIDLFVSDSYASLSPAARKLKRFARVSLQPGESKEVSFNLTADDLSFVNAALERVTEPGEFRVTVGDLTAKLTFAEE
jgi:beta-glucosidase